MFENIAAVSTPIGVGGVAIIRISGDTPFSIAEKIFHPIGKTAVKDFEPYKLYVGEIDAGTFTDFGMCVIFRAPKSYTGENMVEFHCHGGIAIADGILTKILNCGARLATNGEFTKRAFLNGKCSLSSSEGLIDMINGESEAEVKAGFYLYREKLTDLSKKLQDELKLVLAEIDASIDFPDEVELDRIEDIKDKLSEVKAKVDKLKATYSGGRKIKSGVQVAICGRPNTGKSSLLNALLNYDKAIVSAREGTTRDVVEGEIIIDGIRFNLYDTAGIRLSLDEIENLGVERSKKILQSCDLALLVFDGSKPLSKEDSEIVEMVKDRLKITVLNKDDLERKLDGSYDICVSALSGEGLDRLKTMMKDKVFSSEINLSGDIITEKRHYEALSKCSDSLNLAIDRVETEPLDALSVDIRGAWESLGAISGESASEDIIEEIYSKFCVGK